VSLYVTQKNDKSNVNEQNKLKSKIFKLAKKQCTRKDILKENEQKMPKSLFKIQNKERQLIFFYDKNNKETVEFLKDLIPFLKRNKLNPSYRLIKMDVDALNNIFHGMKIIVKDKNNVSEDILILREALSYIDPDIDFFQLGKGMEDKNTRKLIFNSDKNYYDDDENILILVGFQDQ